MGKNQAYKAMQRAKMSSHTAGVVDDMDDGMMDGSFHSPEWHAARLASLQTSHTITWEEFKRKQKDEARRQSELEDSEARRMREYRAQLDAERAAKLSRGRNHSDKRDKASRKGKKDKKKSKKKKPEKKRRRSDESDTDDPSSGSSEDESQLEPKKDKRKLKQSSNKRLKKKTESSSCSSDSPKSSRSSSSSQSDTGETEKQPSKQQLQQLQSQQGPLPLSAFFDNGKAKV